MQPRPAYAVAAFERNLPLARKLARQSKWRFRSSVLDDEIDAAALLGLWQAALSHGELEADLFAYMARVRIQGAILDTMRTIDWLPRLVRKSFGRGLRRVFIDEIEDLSGFGELSTAAPDMASKIDGDRVSAALELAIGRLRKRDRFLIRQVLRGRRQHEIATQMNISQARLSQLLKRITDELRASLVPGSVPPGKTPEEWQAFRAGRRGT